MKKNEQLLINEIVKEEYANMLTAYNSTPFSDMEISGLRSCQAKVITIPGYEILVSYKTIVAFLDTATGTIYDVLRLVYGYTATSAQHIAKFRDDVGYTFEWEKTESGLHCKKMYYKEYRYYPV